MKASLFAILAAGLLMAANHAQDDAVKKEKEKLQGTWAATEGKREANLIFSGDNFTIKGKDKDVFKGTFKIDPGKKPKAIDLTLTEDNEGGKFKGKTSLGIYELEGDTLKWCANEPGKEERPKEFVREAGGSRYLLITFKREKP